MATRGLTEIAEFAKSKLIEYWTAAGHPTWGRFVDNMKHEITENAGDFNIKIISMQYGIFMNYGVRPERVKRSRAYISGIFAWVQKKLGVSDEKEARRITWFIGEKHKRDGIPGSGFIDKMRAETDAEIDKMVRKQLNDNITKIIT